MSGLKDIINIVIADDHQMFSDGLEQVLKDVPGYHVQEKVNNGKLLLRLLNRIKPDLILLDNNMPFMNGIDAAREIKQRFPEIKLIFISMYFDPNIIAICKELKINGYITKDNPADIVKKTIASVIDGQVIYIIPDKQLENGLNSPADEFIKKYKLSPREIDIIRLIKDGMTSKQIHSALHLSELTIETHRKNIYRKLNFSNMSELIRFAIDQNI